MTVRVVIRASAAPEIGAGHLIRTGALGRALNVAGAEVRFAAGPQSLETLSDAYRGDGFETVPALDGALEEAQAVGEAFGTADAVIVDDYRLGAAFETACRAWAKNVVVISDLPDKPHDADVLLDASGGRAAADYAGLVPPACEYLLGPGYALLRELFQGRAARPAAEDGIARIFVSMGATDGDDLTGRAVGVIRDTLPDAGIDILLAGSAPHLASLRARADEDEALKVHTDLAAEDVARLLDACDLAVGTGGVGLWERCALGVPSVTVVAAENQRANARLADERGATVMLGDPAQLGGPALAEALSSLDGAPKLRTALGESAQQLCDGGGAKRAAGKILSYVG